MKQKSRQKKIKAAFENLESFQKRGTCFIIVCTTHQQNHSISQQKEQLAKDELFSLVDIETEV